MGDGANRIATVAEYEAAMAQTISTEVRPGYGANFFKSSTV